MIRGQSPVPILDEQHLSTGECQSDNSCLMAFVVTEPCIKCKFTDCVDVCPVDAFHEGANIVVINPDECIDCGACEPECPTSAIYAEEDVPEKWSQFVQLNSQYAQAWPGIGAKQDPMATAEEFKSIEGKADQLDPNPAG